MRWGNQRAHEHAQARQGQRQCWIEQRKPEEGSSPWLDVDGGGGPKEEDDGGTGSEVDDSEREALKRKA